MVRESNLVRSIKNGSVEPYFPDLGILPAFVVACCDCVRAMTKTKSQELSEKFTEQWQRCRDWLLPYMQNNQPKFLTKDELRSAAMRELKVSKNAFDLGWLAAIEDTGRHDWYEPLRPSRLRTKSNSPLARDLHTA